MTVVLTGPQYVLPHVGGVLRELKVRGPVAVVTAGWQERETDPGLVPDLGVPTVNLTLHSRAEDVFAKDKDFGTAYKERQTRLRMMQDFYRVRLDHAREAARAISVRHVEPVLLAEERKASVDAVKNLDSDHLERCAAVNAAFEAKWPLADRESVLQQKNELAALIQPTDAVLIAGGHVAVLLNRLKLFDLLSLVGNRTIVAWSAGAMTFCELVVLFHENPPHGRGGAEVLDRGLGVVKGVVALPSPRLRLRLDDPINVGNFAMRFAPLACVTLDHGARLVAKRGKVVSGAVTQKLMTDGTIQRGWP
jgi:hypothetical protein